jgi:hypothetical protein
MKFSDFFSRFTALLMIPIFLCSPLSAYHDDAYLQDQLYPDPFDHTKLITFDEVFEYLKQIEDGSLENRCNSSDVDNIYHWVISLARLGVTPGDIDAETELTESILDLIDGSSSEWDYAYKYQDDVHFMLIPKNTAGLIEGYL